MSFFSQLSQNVTLATLNCSSDPLGATATFTGGVSSTLNVAGIQVSLKTDQNCTVYVDQSPDTTPSGPHWDVVDTYDYYTTKPFAVTVQAVSSYLRVRVVNKSMTAQTYLRLQTALCPIVEAVPRSLSAEQNLKVGIYEMLDEPFPGVLSTPTSELRVTPHFKLSGATFEGSGNAGTPDPNFWTPTSASGGSVVQANGSLQLATGGTANGSILVQSVSIARYAAGAINHFRTVVRTPAQTGNCIRRWGAFDANNGYFFEYDGTTLSLVTRKTGSDTAITSFNGDLGASYAMDANAHTWEITWSNKSAWFFVDGAFLHKSTGNTATQVDTPSLKIGLQCYNTGGNTNSNSLFCRVASISRLGQLITESRYKNIAGAATTVCKYGAGRLLRINMNDPNTAGVITIYDNTTNAGTIIATITIPAPGSQSKPIPGSMMFDCPFSTGLTIVTSTATNITAVYE